MESVRHAGAPALVEGAVFLVAGVKARRKRALVPLDAASMVHEQKVCDTWHRTCDVRRGALRQSIDSKAAAAPGAARPTDIFHLQGFQHLGHERLWRKRGGKGHGSCQRVSRVALTPPRGEAQRTVPRRTPVTLVP